MIRSDAKNISMSRSSPNQDHFEIGIGVLGEFGGIGPFTSFGGLGCPRAILLPLT